MNILERIENIRKRPEAERERIVIATAVGITIVLFLFWIFDFTMTQGNPTQTPVAEVPSPISILGSNMQTAFSEAWSSVKGAFSSTTTQEQ